MPITINGTGSITGLSAGGLPDATIVQADLASNVAGNGPTFQAAKASGGNQTIGSNVWTKITYPNENWDTNSNYDTTTSRFTPTVAGYYFVRVSVAVTIVAGTQFSLYRNGTFYAGVTNAEWMEIATIVYLNGSTDYIEGYIWNNTGVGVFENGSTTSFFFMPDTAEYDSFKENILDDKAMLQDADGNEMSAEQAKQFVSTLP